MKVCLLSIIMFSHTARSEFLSDWVGITFGPTSISLHADVIDTVMNEASTIFIVKANSKQTKYDVWVSVKKKYIDTANDVYLGIKGSNKLPLQPHLSGNKRRNAVNVNPAKLQTSGRGSSQPNTGRQIDGDGVQGTDSTNGTIYTINLKEVPNLDNAYPSIPAGLYQLNLVANVQLDD